MDLDAGQVVLVIVLIVAIVLLCWPRDGDEDLDNENAWRDPPLPPPQRRDGPWDR